MKKLFILFCLLILKINLNAQTYLQKCKNIYVWDFSDQNGKTNRMTNDLTNAVEEVLTNIDGCFVIERRNLATLLEHYRSETEGKYSTKQLRSEIKSALNGSEAKLVLFGKIDVSARDVFEIHVKIEQLSTAHIVASYGLTIAYSDITTVENRNSVMNKLISLMIGRVYQQPIDQKIQPDEISKSKAIPIRSEHTDNSKSNTETSNSVPLNPIPNSVIKDPKSGVGVIVESCFGDRVTQTVTINLVYTNDDHPDLLVRMIVEGGIAYGADGDSYPMFNLSLARDERKGKYSGGVEKELFTGARLKASVTFINVLPSTATLANVKIPLSVRLRGQYINYGAIQLKDVQVTW